MYAGGQAIVGAVTHQGSRGFETAPSRGWAATKSPPLFGGLDSVNSKNLDPGPSTTFWSETAEAASREFEPWLAGSRF
jgi:hypothetical protein